MKHSKMISRRSFLQAAASAAALSALALTGCSSSSGASSAAGGSSAASASGTVYKVGIVNYVDDASLNQIVASVEAGWMKWGLSGVSPSITRTITPTPRRTSPT